MTRIAVDLAPLAEAIIAHEKAKGEAASRFRMAMAESVLAMAAREQSRQQSLAEADASLLALEPQPLASIRAGKRDGDHALYQALLTSAALRTSITKPAMLSESERALVKLD
jgi:hypothetical protein